eukprot:scaffold5795_cov165-Amphora_coffeaeformis.AAC.6
MNENTGEKVQERVFSTSIQREDESSQTFVESGLHPICLNTKKVKGHYKALPNEISLVKNSVGGYVNRVSFGFGPTELHQL